MRLRSAVDKAVSNRETYVNKFCFNLDKDITELGKEVKEIKTEGQVWRYYASSNMAIFSHRHYKAGHLFCMQHLSDTLLTLCRTL